ncbi:CRISPR-associated endoribonuclease Cas6 [Thermoactinomyces sp. DSM 45891]|uniref:CRISPR-associated endoribonuclease Cas6 n=1 Tax=Thermoactinomyces sp. DSM 45891 TaxID=1761907 RepID=UPI000931A361|nr:CRISPR-associated endoribonuclease Cas6 [Thermoactinomyces sp. DSM 45891]
MKYFFDSELSIPYSLNYPLLSYLYECLSSVDEDLASWLHGEGISYQNRKYKPLTFSGLRFSNKQKRHRYQIVKGTATLMISSMNEALCMKLIEGMWKKQGLLLLDAFLPLIEVKILPEPEYQENMRYRSLSPIVVPVQDSNKKTHFCHPLESRFFESIKVSLKNWYYIKWGEHFPENIRIDLSVLHPERFQLKKSAVLTEVKKKKIKAYELDLEVHAPIKLQQVIYEQSLGSYGIQGFGMMEII